MSFVKPGVAAPPAALAPFLAVLERASDRTLRSMSVLVADAFVQREEFLESASEDQNDVLDVIAKLVGIDVPLLDQPLSDPSREAEIQREAWDTASTWAVLTLLWTLARDNEASVTVDGWPEAAAHTEEPAGGSSLDEQQEKLALSLAATVLAESSDLVEGRCLMLQDLPRFVSAESKLVRATPIDPRILVYRRGDSSAALLPKLVIEDEVWLADTSAGPPIDGPYRTQSNGAVTMLGSGEIVLPPDVGLTVVADRIWCYCSGI